MIGIIFALAAAVVWGSGDFCGGLAARKFHQFQVLLLANVSSLLVLLLFSLVAKESLPTTIDLTLSVVAGLSGALGLAALYKGLSLGNTAYVAPVAGVVGAIVPTLVGMWVEGLPGILTRTGFVLGLVGIGFVARSENRRDQQARMGLGLALLAGIGFGIFLTLIAQVESGQVFMPLVFSKSASLLLAFLLVGLRRIPYPKLTHSPLALLSGTLDAGGNIFYLYATQNARLDIAALLSSLYPAGTVLLFSLVLKEKLTMQQWLGVSACMLAILLITTG